MICPVDQSTVFDQVPFYYQWNNKRFQMVKCRDCGLITLDPKPTEEELQLLYSEDYFDHGAHGLDHYQKTYEEMKDAVPMKERVQNIESTILQEKPDATSLFEIGAAMGYYLDAARSLGLRVSGLEISASANKRAKEKFSIDLYSGDFEKIDLSTEYGKWDVVYGGDVFEHFSNPGIVVEKIFHLLKPGGIAYIVVPSTFNLFSTRIATFGFRLLGKQQKLVDNPYHLYEYTTSTLKKIFETCFNEVKVINKIKSPRELNLKTKSLGYRIKYMIHLLNYPVTKMFGVNGDRLTAVARKS
jgi:2-polyprenyl-3-methyl-5-hydroxy-6-metoxy-1,4-benzoquinol methylase